MMNMTQISQKKVILIGRVTAPGYQTTARDVAEAQELVNQYIDELERLEKTAKPYHGEIDIVINGKIKHFKDGLDEFVNWLTS